MKHYGKTDYKFLGVMVPIDIASFFDSGKDSWSEGKAPYRRIPINKYRKK